MPRFTNPILLVCVLAIAGCAQVDETPTTDEPTTLSGGPIPDSVMGVAGGIVQFGFQVIGDGGVVPNYDLHLEVTAGGGQVPAVLRTNQDGSIAVNWELGPTPGLNSLVVTAPGLQGSPRTIFAWGTHRAPLGDTTTVVDFAFEPNNLLIDVGGKLTFIGQGPSSHQIFVEDISGCEVMAGQDCEWSGLPFWPGTYQVRSETHPDMVATLVIRE